MAKLTNKTRKPRTNKTVHADNGAIREPEGAGNTKSPSGSKAPGKPRDSQKYHWVLTLPAETFNHHNIRQWIELHCDSAWWQKEKGKETEYIHWQCYFVLKKKRRFNEMKSFFPGAHIEEAKSFNHSLNYCTKSDTRIAGPFCFPDPMICCKNPSGWDPIKSAPFANEILKTLEGEADRRKIIWYVDPIGNKGKTTFQNWLTWENHDIIAMPYSGSKKDFMSALVGNKTSLNPKAICIDIARAVDEHTFDYTILEALKNGRILQEKYKSAIYHFSVPHVFVFSNWEPNQSKLSTDRWDIRLIV